MGNPRADWSRHWRGEATLILPEAAGDAAHAAVRKALVNAFGGLTADHMAGCWRDAAGKYVTDASIRYTVAVPSLALPRDRGGVVSHETERLWLFADDTLRTIAREAAKAGKQDCVYWRSADGRVWFTTPDGPDYDGYQHGGYAHAQHEARDTVSRLATKAGF